MVERNKASASKPLSFWLLSAVCAVLSLAVIICLLKFFGSGESESERALAQSQHLTINIKTGEITGTPHNTTPEAAPTDEPPTDTVAQTPPAFDVGEPEPAVTAPVETPVAATPEPTLSDAMADSKSALVASEDEAVSAIPVYPRTSASLAAPSPELSENGVPTIGSAGTPSRYYARSFTPRANTPLIAIIVTNLGYSKATTEAALKLPLDVSLSFNPYGEFTPLWVENARNLGHEAWLMLPAQPADFPASDPGPLGLLKEAPATANITKLQQLLATAPGAVGVLMPPHQVLTESAAATETLVAELKKRGIALALTENPSSALEQRLDSIKTHVLPTPFILDARADPASMAAQLNALEKMAQSKGFAVGISLGYPTSITALDNWTRGLDPAKFQLTPASALLGRK